MSFTKVYPTAMCEDCTRHLFATDKSSVDLSNYKGKTEQDAITTSQKCFPCPVYGQVKSKNKIV